MSAVSMLVVLVPVAVCTEEPFFEAGGQFDLHGN
jgi:hypothetical protein